MEISHTSSSGEGGAGEETDRFVDSTRAQSMLEGFAKLYENEAFVDVTLVVGNHEFPCHRNVLAISSPFFMGMFSNDLAEKDQPKVRIEEMGVDTMQSVLDYMYTGTVQLTDDIVQGILSAANLFQMFQLRNGCAKYMITRVDMSNSIGVFFFARAHQCHELANKAQEIIHRNFTKLCREQEFLLLPKDRLQEILNDDRLNVTSEETVYESCLAWINYDLENRRQYLVEIMKCIRFANVSSYYFCDNIATFPLLAEEPELKKILDNVNYYHILKNRQQEIDLNFMPRAGMNYERGVIIIANPHSEDSDRKFNSMEFLIPSTGTIYHLNKLPQSVYMPGVCVSGDNQIFLAGGAIRKINYRGPFSTEGVSNGLYIYDKNNGSWQVKAQMLMGRSQFCLAIVDGIMLAVGGQNEVKRLDSVEAYDIAQNRWTYKAPLPQPLRCSTAVGYKGALYVFGGEKESEIVKTAYRYSMTDDTWVELPSMTTPRALAGSIVYKDKIYIIGGNSGVSDRWRKELLPEHCVSTVEVFDPATEEWSVGLELPNALCGAGVLKYGDSVMILGGEDDKSWMAGCYILRRTDGGKECWTEGQELSTAMSTFGCVMANIPKDMLKDT